MLLSKGETARPRTQSVLRPPAHAVARVAARNHERVEVAHADGARRRIGGDRDRAPLVPGFILPPIAALQVGRLRQLNCRSGVVVRRSAAIARSARAVHGRGRRRRDVAAAAAPKPMSSNVAGSGTVLVTWTLSMPQASRSTAVMGWFTA